jgi:AraC-like DNA-binding protein
MTSIPTLNLNSEDLPTGNAFPAYQATLPFYRLTMGPGVTLETFKFHAAAWLFEDLILSRTSASAVHVSRTPEHIRADNTDNYSFFAFTRGGWEGDFDGRPIMVGPGQIVGFDLSKPFEAQATDHSALALAVARTSVSKQFGNVPNLHGHIFEGVGAEMLLDHLLSLERHVANMEITDIPTVIRATLGMVNAALTTIPKRAEIEPGVIAFQHDVRRFIENHLHDGDLTPDRIASELSVARSTLFRAFKPLGGVAGYVQRRRLEVIRGLLLNPLEARSISDLALTFGFTNQSHFAVAFKKAFGRSASEIRNLVTLTGPVDESAEGGVPKAYLDWKRRLVLR